MTEDTQVDQKPQPRSAQQQEAYERQEAHVRRLTDEVIGNGGLTDEEFAAKVRDLHQAEDALWRM